MRAFFGKGHAWTDRQTDIQTDKDRQKERKNDKKADRQTDRQKERKKEKRQKDRQKDRHSHISGCQNNQASPHARDLPAKGLGNRQIRLLPFPRERIHPPVHEGKTYKRGMSTVRQCRYVRTMQWRRWPIDQCIWIRLGARCLQRMDTGHVR